MSNKKWDIGVLDLSRFKSKEIPLSLIYVIKATCLLESRADLYSSYLLSVFQSKKRWRQAIQVWNLEERQHGQALRKWCELVDPDFSFEKLYSGYISEVLYHREDGNSVRGSINGELIARCVIEALASGYYAAIRDTVEEPLLREICGRLSKDEARHYGMFYRFFREVQKTEPVGRWECIKIITKRILELEDDQIIYASYYVRYSGSQATYDRRIEARRYLNELYPIYRKRHLRYILSLILPILGFEKHRLAHRFLTVGVYLVVKVRLMTYRLYALKKVRLKNKLLPPSLP